MTKVLRGVFQLNFAIAAQKSLCKEFYSMKQMDQEYDKRHDFVQAHSRQVIQTVCQELESLDNFHIGKPWLLNVPFWYIAGACAPCWDSSSTNGMERVEGHKQFQMWISIRILCMKEWLAWVNKQKTLCVDMPMLMLNLIMRTEEGWIMDYDEYIDWLFFLVGIIWIHF